MSAHTPGPRIVEPDNDEYGNVYWAVHGKDYEFVANFDNRADALLDAAAPELLEAAIELANLSNDELTALAEAYRRLDAAIAKATGEKP